MLIDIRDGKSAAHAFQFHCVIRAEELEEPEIFRSAPVEIDCPAFRSYQHVFLNGGTLLVIVEFAAPVVVACTRRENFHHQQGMVNDIYYTGISCIAANRDIRVDIMCLRK